jgi:hypothetical protein
VQPDEVETRLAGDDTPLVHRPPLPVEHRKIDPRKAGVVAGAPDHVLHLEHATVGEERKTVANADDPGDTFGASGHEILRLDANERRGLVQELGAQLASHRRADRQHVMSDEPHHADEQESADEGFDTKRNVARLLSRDPGAMAARDLEPDVGAGVTHSDDEHAAIAKLRRVLVFGGV